MFTHNITTQYSDNAGLVTMQANPYNGQTQAAFDGTIAANTTNQLVSISWPVTGMQSVLLSSNVNLTVLTNSTTTPGQTINLLANIPIVWGPQQGGANPITVAVTALYVTNGTANPATFKVRALTT
jgi:hypothetical protein